MGVFGSRTSGTFGNQANRDTVGSTLPLQHGHHIQSAVWLWLSPSQGGPLVGILFTCFPSSLQVRLFTVSRPLPAMCLAIACGRLLDPADHHQAACAEAEVLGRQASL